jgi:cytochrome c oxidase subunit 1
VFGYTACVLSLVAIGFLSFGLWVHHMFATPLPQTGQSFFTAASAMIAIPTGVTIFCWIATIWSGRPRFDTPMLFVVGFIALFMIGGLSGLMIASVPVDLQLTDTFFLPGHIHYVLIGGMVFPLLGALFYWFPKVTGRVLSESLGKVSFWLLFVGVNLTFFPQLLLGMAGMPRRVYTYMADTGWGGLNLTSSIGAGVLALGLIVLLLNVVRAMASPKNAPADPWGGETLEWAVSSPAPDYNFAYIPIVRGRSPLWVDQGELDAVSGLREDRREVLQTTMLDAVPDSRHEHPDPTITPLLAALAVGVTLIAGIFDPMGFVVGGVLTLFALIAWGWPKQTKPNTHEIAELPQ